MERQEVAQTRKQFRRKHRRGGTGPVKPVLATVVRRDFLEPVICLHFLNMPLGVHDGHTFGLIGSIDMEGYAAHFASGVPWFTSQSPVLAAVAPPGENDPLRHRDFTLRKTWRERRRPEINRLDRIALRRKYLVIAEAYLTGHFKGFHARVAAATTPAPPFPLPTPVDKVPLPEGAVAEYQAWEADWFNRQRVGLGAPS